MEEFYVGDFNDIKTRNELADFLNVPRKQLSYILYVKGVDKSYTSFEIQKKTGGIRKIHAPSNELKYIQKKLAQALYKNNGKKQNKRNNISHAFEKEKGIISNAKIHRKKRVILNIDLENFFESFHFGRVRGFFIKNNDFLLSTEVATVIAQLACYNGKLPQGSPSSPIITNLVCEILDRRISKIAKIYKLHYTRYADDLTFSTNDKKFLNLQDEFYEKISKEIIKAGFKINDKKTRLQLKDSRQIVTGLVVNKKVNVNRTYSKETRAMVQQLYKQGSFEINGKAATLNQLEGRLAFINQLTKYNNKLVHRKLNFNNLNSTERQYQKFLTYKYFFANPKPLIVTEGKTDVVYLRSALKSLYKEYPNLITRNSEGDFEFKVSFLKKTKRLKHFLGIYPDGGNALNNISDFYKAKNPLGSHLNCFKKVSSTLPKNPVFLLFDNELRSKKEKPISQFLKHAKITDKKSDLEKDNTLVIKDNLYLLTVPLVSGKLECDIEDLFDSNTLSYEYNGKTFSKSDTYDTSKHYGKEIFSKYILNNYTYIDFTRFRPLLNNIDNVISTYSKETGMTINRLETINLTNSSTSKVPIEI